MHAEVTDARAVADSTYDPEQAIPLPLRLAPLAAFLVELAAKEITQRGGTRSAMRDLPELEAILRAPATGASATPAGTMGPPPKPEELTTVQARRRPHNQS